MPLAGEYEPNAMEWVRDHVARYEASGGKEGTEMNGYPCVVLTSKGARSGHLRKTPVIKVKHGDTYVAVASMGGQPKNPAWVHNLLAHPEVRLQDGPEVRTYRARLVEGDDRAVWWDRAVAAFPPYAGYQRKTERVIPVFLLEPLAEEPSQQG